MFFHPLSSFKGPLLWRVFRFPFIKALVGGNLPHQVRSLHEKYGPVVRVGPDELSFTDPAAWKDIYAKGFLRAPQYSNKPPGKDAENLISANEFDHARFRKVLAPAFAEKSIHEHEQIIIDRINLLIHKIQHVDGNHDSASVDILKWYNFIALDIIGDLIWSTSFGCLDQDRYPSWLQIIDQFKVTMIRVAFRYYPPANFILNLIMSKAAFAPITRVWRDIEERLSQRLASSAHHTDIVSHIDATNKASSDTYMSRSEIEINILSLVVAGSESVTTVLAGLTNHLLRDPEKLDHLVSEIRSAFQDEQEINGIATSHLPYLNTVLQEAMRLCPTIPDGMRRVVPKGGATVAGHFLPENTVVSVPQWATYRSKSNFSSPSSFCPERWLPESSQMSSPYISDRRDAFNPFSLGNRNCPGRALAFLEMRLILAKVLWNFDIETSSEVDLPVWDEQDIYWFWVKKPTYVNLKKASWLQKQQDVYRHVGAQRK